MGTTLSALQADDGVSLCFVLAIEGYENLVTDNADTAAVVTAWSGTDWTAAIGGLRVDGRFSQALKPWNDKVDVGRLTFYVSDYDGNDTFGIAVHKTTGGNKTMLLADITSDGTTLTVTNTDDFASSGSIYIGPERIKFAGKTTTPDTFTGCTRGWLCPVGADTVTDEMGREHRIPQYDFDAFGDIVVSDEPRMWIGKTVALYAHRVVGGVLDVRSEAQRVFVGRIKDVADTSSGETAMVCEDLRSMIRDCVLLRDQFTGVVTEGVYLAANTYFKCKTGYWNGGSLDVDNATQLDVKASPSGNYEIQDGYWALDDILGRLNEWLNQAVADADIEGTWSVKRTGTTDGERVVFSWTLPTADYGHFILTAANGVWDFFGFTRDSPGYGTVTSPDDEDESSVVSDDAPYRVRAFRRNAYELDLDSATGEWVNNAEWFPQRIRETTTGGNWGLLQIGSGDILLAEYSSDTAFTDVRIIEGLNRTFTEDKRAEAGIRWGEEGGIVVRQIVVLNDTFLNLVGRLFATTGATNVYNHATYDETDWSGQLGAGIPWDALGADFVTSITNELSETTSSDSLIVYLEKPTRLSEVLAPELLLRNAHLVWKNGSLRFVAMATPEASYASHTLTEDNKAVASGTSDPNRAPAIRSVEHCRNVVKLSYDRDLQGKYRNEVTVKHAESIAAIGERPITIKCRNTFGDYAAAGDSVKELMSELIAYTLSVWAMPLYRVRRTLDFAYFQDVAPGDQVTVTDNFVRGEDGVRGTTSRAGIILKHAYEWGAHGAEMSGEVEVTFTDLNYKPYCPTAQIDDTATGGGFDAGYNSGTDTIRCYTHEFSESAETRDAGHFEAGDTIWIVEIDPDLPGTTVSWERTVNSVSADDIELTTSLSSPAWDNTMKYHIYSDTYGDAQTSQQGDTYQADSDDMLIEDTASPLIYGVYPEADAITAVDVTRLPERYSDDMHGDGNALHTGAHRNICRMINNLVAYKLTRQAPFSVFDGTNAYHEAGFLGAPHTDWQLLYVKPYFVGAWKDVAGGRTRSLSLAPSAAMDAAGDDGEVRITISLNPPDGTTTINVTHYEPKLQLTYTISGTTLTIATAQTVGAVGRPWNGWGWMSVEAKSSGTEVVRIYGIGEDRMGPLG